MLNYIVTCNFLLAILNILINTSRRNQKNTKRIVLSISTIALFVQIVITKDIENLVSGLLTVLCVVICYAIIFLPYTVVEKLTAWILISLMLVMLANMQTAAEYLGMSFLAILIIYYIKMVALNGDNNEKD